MTPEGKVKAKVSALLKKYGAYSFMPVPTGYGKKTVDYLICFLGVFIAIETKAPGKVPTTLQELALAEIERAGGVTFVIDGPAGLQQLEAFLNVTLHGKSETQDGGRAGGGDDHQPVPRREAA